MRPFPPASRLIADPTLIAPEGTVDADALICRGCAAEILREPFGDGFYTPDGSGFCDAAETRPHLPRTPDCRVADLILTWDEVAEGDLVVHKGRFEVVVKVHDPHPKSRLGVQFRGRRGASWVRRDSLTAVRRYTETCEG